MQCVGLGASCALSSSVHSTCAFCLTLPTDSGSSQAIAFPYYCLRFTSQVYKTVAVYLSRD
jgi:hypothetical protein